MVTRSILSRRCFGLLAWLCLPWAAACLPDPLINVPDLSPGPLTDGGMVAKMDAPAGDLGSYRFSLDTTAGSGATLRDVWVADPGVSEAFIVGHGGTVLHRVANGAFTAEASGTTANLYAIAATSAAEVYAVGEGGVILRRSSGAWKAEGGELHLTASLFGVTVLASGEVVAIGDSGVIVRRQTAGVWTLEPTPALSGVSLRAVFGSQLEGLYAVGLGSTIAKRVTGNWQLDSLPIDPGGAGNYYAIAGSSDGSQVHIVGEYGVVLHRATDGSHWQAEKLVPPMSMTAPLHLFGVYYQDGELIVAGAGGTVERRTAAGVWSTETTGVTSDLYGLGGAGLRSILVVGAQGAVLRRM